MRRGALSTNPTPHKRTPPSRPCAPPTPSSLVRQDRTPPPQPRPPRRSRESCQVPGRLTGTAGSWSCRGRRATRRPRSGACSADVPTKVLPVPGAVVVVLPQSAVGVPGEDVHHTAVAHRRGRAGDGAAEVLPVPGTVVVRLPQCAIRVVREYPYHPVVGGRADPVDDLPADRLPVPGTVVVRLLQRAVGVAGEHVHHAVVDRHPAGAVALPAEVLPVPATVVVR